MTSLDILSPVGRIILDGIEIPVAGGSSAAGGYNITSVLLEDGTQKYVITTAKSPENGGQVEEYEQSEPIWFLADAGAIFAPSAAGMKYGDFTHVKLPKSYKEGGEHLIEYQLTPSNVSYLFMYLEKVAYKFWFISNGTITKINNQSEFNNVYSTLETLLGTQGYVDVIWPQNMCLAGNEESITHIWPNAFKYFTQLTGSLTFPETYKSIGSYAFYDCMGLTSLIFNEGLEEIGQAAFSGCSSLMDELNLPSTLITIGNAAFYGCRGITSIRLAAQTPPTLGDTAAIPDTVTKIYIPTGTLEAYRTAENWSNFANLFDDGTLPPDDVGGNDYDNGGGWNDGWDDGWDIL